jgi:hypothetical protein
VDASGLQCDYKLDFHCTVSRQFCDADSGSCMHACFAENFPEKVRHNICDPRLLVESLGRRDEHDDLENLPYSVEGAERKLQRRQRVQGRETSRLGSLFECHVVSDLAWVKDHFPRLRHVSAHIADAIVLRDRLIRPRRRLVRRQLDAKIFQLIFCHLITQNVIQ